MKIAFFDLDRTLLSTNSAKGWIFQEYRKGRMTTKNVGRAMWWLMMYRFRGTGMEQAIDEGAATLRATKEDIFVERTNLYWKEKCEPKIRPGAYSCLKWHQEQDHHIALITGSSIYLAQAAAQEFGIPHVLANRFVVEQGIFTGGTHKPLCYGEGKVILAQDLLDQLDISFAESFFYTDSYSDVPLLEKVAYPKVIAPDMRLKKYAKKRGWAILNWD
jgi:HAD superfamily hydrolase (TIGR01490 family)